MKFKELIKNQVSFMGPPIIRRILSDRFHPGGEGGAPLGGGRSLARDPLEKVVEGEERVVATQLAKGQLVEVLLNRAYRQEAQRVLQEVSHVIVFD